MGGMRGEGGKAGETTYKLWYSWRNERTSAHTEGNHVFPGPSVFDGESPSELMIKTPLHRHISEPAKSPASCPDPSPLSHSQSCRHLLTQEPPTTFVDRGPYVEEGEVQPLPTISGWTRQPTAWEKTCFRLTVGHAQGTRGR